jgi:hypothetical protein
VEGTAPRHVFSNTSRSRPTMHGAHGMPGPCMGSCGTPARPSRVSDGMQSAGRAPGVTAGPVLHHGNQWTTPPSHRAKADVVPTSGTNPKFGAGTLFAMVVVQTPRRRCLHGRPFIYVRVRPARRAYAEQPALRTSRAVR